VLRCLLLGLGVADLSILQSQIVPLCIARARSLIGLALSTDRREEFRTGLFARIGTKVVFVRRDGDGLDP